MVKVAWKAESDPHDFPAAASYLTLLLDDPPEVDRLMAALASTVVSHFKAKDILRAAQLPLLPASDPHVAKDLRKIRKNRPLAPVLLLRGDLARGFPLQVADGYHRVCASYRTAEDTDIPCRIVTLPAATPSPTRPQDRRPRKPPATRNADA